MQARHENRFYPARFVLQWATREAEELAEWLDTSPPESEVRRRAVLTAAGVLSNYRIALEHVAFEVARAACPDASPERVSFPVAQDAYAFRSMMVTRFPALRMNHPKVWNVFRDAQSFRPGAGDWLPMLHGLWNRTVPIEVAFHGTEPVATGRPPATVRVGRAYLAYAGQRPLLELLPEIDRNARRLIGRFESTLPPEDEWMAARDRRDRRWPTVRRSSELLG